MYWQNLDDPLFGDDAVADTICFMTVDAVATAYRTPSLLPTLRPLSRFIGFVYE